MHLILASTSPRRADLLRQIGIDFTVIPPQTTEKLSENRTPQEIALHLAHQKAYSVAKQLDSGIILGVDTLVVFQDQVLGKPADRHDAIRMLYRLSGNQHTVITGLVLIDASSMRNESGTVSTKVWMKKLAEQDIESYVASGEPLDKAGAYGIQGRAALFIERIEGCYFNVVGLPLSLLHDLLVGMSVPIWPDRKDGKNAR